MTWRIAAGENVDEGFGDRRHGAVAGPMEVWLALRGLRTLAVRMDRACANAATLTNPAAASPVRVGSAAPNWR